MVMTQAVPGGELQPAAAGIQTQVEEQEFAVTEGESPLVGIVMGSQSDMPVMEKAG